MKRGLTWIGGAFGLAWLWRWLRREPEALERPRPDPAEELRARLDEARASADDRDEYDAAEGQPLDEVGAPQSLEERRRQVHDKAEQALDEMKQPLD